MKGLDCAFDLTKHIPALKATGIEFAPRYLSHDIAKDLSPAEAEALSAAGILIVTVWESSATAALSGFTQGQRDAQQAMVLAEQCGQPERSAIYFAVDFDATNAQLAGAVVPYFQGIAAEVGAKYLIGAYGSGAVLSALHMKGLIEYGWLAQARGWSGTEGYGGAHIIQGPEDVELLGPAFPVDTDVSEGDDFGGWTISKTAVVVAGGTPATEADVAETIKILQAQLASLGYYKGAVDGIAGPQTQAALIAYENA